MAGAVGQADKLWAYLTAQSLYFRLWSYRNVFVAIYKTSNLPIVVHLAWMEKAGFIFIDTCVSAFIFLPRGINGLYFFGLWISPLASPQGFLVPDKVTAYGRDPLLFPVSGHSRRQDSWSSGLLLAGCDPAWPCSAGLSVAGDFDILWHKS